MTQTELLPPYVTNPYQALQSLMPFRIQDILLVSSLYDSFILAEDGTHHNAQAVVRDQVRDAMQALFGLPATGARP